MRQSHLKHPKSVCKTPILANSQSSEPSVSRVASMTWNTFPHQGRWFPFRNYFLSGEALAPRESGEKPCGFLATHLDEPREKILHFNFLAYSQFICQVIYSQFGLAIHQNDHQARRRFVEWAQNEIAVVPDFHKRILFSDEAHFWLNGYVNKQNCRIWSEANPQVYVKTPLHAEKLTVWCALWAGGIIGPYFFKIDESHNELWFQQDGATCHTARATIDLLKDTFGDRLISRFGPVNWPSRSCDLTPLDYFLWGYIKSLVYADKPQTLDHLEDNIRRVIADIQPQMLEKVIENWTSTLDYIRASRGNHMQEIIFKM
ncbi:transposable element Tc3 transposase [Trichonephila clavipes]|nr:transposable element Tc3 transposase [Trichonephila clavipes]